LIYKALAYTKKRECKFVPVLK